jgi:hypothetical protein
MGDMFILIVIMMAYRLQQFSKGIVFLILVFLLKVTTGLSAGGGTRTLQLYSRVYTIVTTKKSLCIYLYIHKS